jgi:hypothetical protein
LHGVIQVLYIFSRFTNPKEHKNMALVKFGGGISGFAGKVGGTVYGRNKSGAYARNWAVPVNPVTLPQSRVRSNLAHAAAKWSGLSFAEVSAWNAYAAVLIRTNRQGDQYTPSGRQIFMETYINLIDTGTTPFTYPSGVINSPSVDGASITDAEVDPGTHLFTNLTSSIVGVTLPSGIDPADAVVRYFSAPTHPPSRKNVNTQIRLVLTEDASTVSLDWHGQFNALFGPSSNVGHVVDAWFKVIDTGSGFASPLYKTTFQTTSA